MTGQGRASLGPQLKTTIDRSEVSIPRYSIARPPGDFIRVLSFKSAHSETIVLLDPTRDWGHGREAAATLSESIDAQWREAFPVTMAEITEELQRLEKDAVAPYMNDEWGAVVGVIVVILRESGDVELLHAGPYVLTVYS